MLLLFACSNKEQKPANEPASPSASDLMKEEPAYDATKINPNAPVVNITLHAQGNSMTDMHYDQAELKVAAGSTVKLMLINEGTDPAMMHNFVLIDEGKGEEVAKEGLTAGQDKNYVPANKHVLVSTKMVQPKSKEEITFPAPEKGTYDFICTYPGHWQKMNGKFIVG